MNRVWIFLTKPIVPPGSTAACLTCSVVFLISAYVGYWGGLKFEAHARGRQFEVLGKTDAAEFRRSVDALTRLEVSSELVPGEISALAKTGDYLSQLRADGPSEMAGIIDLSRALNYLQRARLQQNADPREAAEETREAKKILASLGWHELSDDKLMALAEASLRRRVK